MLSKRAEGKVFRCSFLLLVKALNWSECNLRQKSILCVHKRSSKKKLNLYVLVCVRGIKGLRLLQQIVKSLNSEKKLLYSVNRMKNKMWLCIEHEPAEL